MDLSFSPEEEAFRTGGARLHRRGQAEAAEDDVGAPEAANRSKEDYLAWHKLLYKKGWVAPLWPKEYGGTGWNVTQRYIFNEEMRQRRDADDAAVRSQHGRAGDLHLRQRRAEEEVPAAHPLRRGLVVPGLFRAGRGLRPRHRCAPRRCATATHYIVNGQKTWTTLAQYRRLDLLPGPHRSRRQAAGRHHLPADRHEDARHHRASRSSCSTARTR